MTLDPRRLTVNTAMSTPTKHIKDKEEGAIQLREHHYSPAASKNISEAMLPGSFISMTAPSEIQQLFNEVSLFTTAQNQVALVHIWWYVLGIIFDATTFSRKIEHYTPRGKNSASSDIIYASPYVTIKGYPKESKDITIFRALILTNADFDNWNTVEAFMREEVIPDMGSNPNGRIHVIICFGFEMRIWQYGAMSGRFHGYDDEEWIECTTGPLRLKGFKVDQVLYRDHGSFILDQLENIRQHGEKWATCYREGKDPSPVAKKEPFFPRVMLEDRFRRQISVRT